MNLPGFERTVYEDATRGTSERLTETRHVVIAGGGLAGLSAATVLAERGARVTVVEREAYLGGRVGAFADRLVTGEPFEMERGFHAFFRQYYNLRRLLRRVDPSLSNLVPLEDYPILTPTSRVSFRDLPRIPPFNVAMVLARSRALTLPQLLRAPSFRAISMLAYDPARTYARWDETSARAYLDALEFPEDARRLLFDVFAHSFFNPEDDMSAAELLMQFHFYFLGNPEGLLFDVMKVPFSTGLFEPLRAYLASLGVQFSLETIVERVERPNGRLRVVTSRGDLDADALVLATTVPGLQRIAGASPALFRQPTGGDAGRYAEQIASLGTTWPFAVLRLFLDRPCRPSRSPFVGTSGFGILDNVSIYERFESESRTYFERTGGSVVELHAYAVPRDRQPEDLRAELLAGMHRLYRETADARIVDERFLLRDDCPSFAPGKSHLRPGVETPCSDVVLAGDYVRMPFPTALMERAASSGFLAGNRLLDRWNVRGEPLFSVPRRGIFSRLPIDRAAREQPTDGAGLGAATREPQGNESSQTTG